MLQFLVANASCRNMA